MRASLRWKNLLLGGLLLLPATAEAQSTSEPPPSSPPAADAVGPQELQNFSLTGKVTQPADQQPGPTARTPPSPAVSKADNNRADGSTAPSTVVQEQPPRRSATKTAALVAPNSAPPKPVARASVSNIASSLNALPSARSTPQSAITTPLPTPSFSTASIPAPAQPLGPEHKLPIWPWLLAAFTLACATAFLLWRRRQQEAFAGGPHLDLFVAPEPVPAVPRSAPVPAPRRAAATPSPLPGASKPTTPASTGIISTRLRPSLDVGVQLLRCLVEDERVVLEFELELFNAGTAPARAVLAEASMFNAGVTQEQELGAFFAKPSGAGERLDVIPPMKRVTFINQVVAPRTSIQEYELGGRNVFVPVLAFNALYTWSGGEAQTSAAYLVGRDTAGEKLGPLTLEHGPRQIVKLAARPLPTGLRT